MMNFHTLELAGLVSQATFALTLALLAWSDRRSQGMRWLAGACGLQMVGTALRPLWSVPGETMSQAAGACLLVLLFFCVYMGLRWYVVRSRDLYIGGPLLVSLSMALVMGVSPFSAGLAMVLARVAAMAIMGKTIMMLLGTRFEPLRRAAWVNIFLLATMSALMVVQMPLDVHLVDVSGPVEASLRIANLVGMSLLAFAFIAMFVAEATRRLQNEARMDPLTGLRNRRAMEEVASEEMRLSMRSGEPLSMLVLDVDHFKKLNDTWGHALGDRALRAIGGVLLTVTGADERVMRMGGEEFAVLLPGSESEAARQVGERLRATVEGLRMSEKNDVMSFTVSIGVGEWKPGDESWMEMLHRADQALYRAKHEGRNCVVVGTMDRGAKVARRAQASGAMVQVVSGS